MNTTTNEKGPAEAATSPSHGSINLLRGNSMNTQVNNIMKGEAASTSHDLDYLDLESSILTAANMAEIACDKIEVAQGKFNKTAKGYHLTDNEMQLVSFAIYHTSDLIKDIKRRWVEVHEANSTKGVSA